MKKYLPLLFLLAACVDDPNKVISIDEIIAFDAAQKYNVDADNASALSVVVSLGKDVTNEQEVTFTADRGKFQGADQSNTKTYKVTTVNKRATATLIADQSPGNVGLTTSVKANNQAYINAKTVSFDGAYPAKLFVTADKLVVKPDMTSQTTFTVLTERAAGKGQVSNDLIVNITPKITAGNLTVEVLPYVKTGTNPLTFTVRSRNNEEGTVNIRVSMTDSQGNEVSDNKDITFKN